MSNARPHTIILSSGRCGSTLLSEMLELHTNVLSVSELFMAINTRAFVHSALDGKKFWRKLSRPSRAMSKILTPQTVPHEFKFDLGASDRFRLDTLPPILFMALPRLSPTPEALYDELEAALSSRPFAPLENQFAFMFEWLCGRLNKNVWVERSGGSLMYAHSLVRTFPEAKFVHLYRDGREVAHSIQRYPPLRLLAQSWHSTKKWGIDLLTPPFRLGESKAIYYAQDYLTPLQNFNRQLEKPVELSVIGAFWSEMIRTGLDALDAVPDHRKHSLAYEDLVAAPEEHLTALLEFIDTDLPAHSWIEQARALIKPTAAPQRHRDDLVWDQLNAACAPGLERLGYPLKRDTGV